MKQYILYLKNGQVFRFSQLDLYMVTVDSTKNMCRIELNTGASITFLVSDWDRMILIEENNNASNVQ